MAENATNRRWLVTSNLQGSGTRPAPDAQALLYYQAQLEAELEEVRRRIREVTLAR